MKINDLLLERSGQLPRRQRRVFQRKLDQVVPPVLRNTVPDRLWAGRPIRQRVKASFDMSVVIGRAKVADAWNYFSTTGARATAPEAQARLRAPRR